MNLATVIPYLKKIQKEDQRFFHRKLAIFGISGNASIDCILMH